jgi:hypothetical protein
MSCLETTALIKMVDPMQEYDIEYTLEYRSFSDREMQGEDFDQIRDRALEQLLKGQS